MVLAAARPGFRHSASTAVPFVPTSIANLAIWLDAGQITGSSDGVAVGTWQDRSGNGRNATQVTGSKQPIFRSSGALLTSNGKPCLQFDSVDDVYATACPQSDSFTFFAVVNVTSLAAQRSFIGSDVSGGLEFRSEVTGLLTELREGQAQSTSSTTGITANVYNVVELYKVANGAGSYVLNGTNVGNFTDATSFVASNITIGSGGVSGLTEFFVGGYAEMLRYDRVLTTTERQQVESYLKTKYGTP